MTEPISLEEAKSRIEAADEAILALGYVSGKPTLGDVDPEERQLVMDFETLRIDVSENRG